MLCNCTQQLSEFRQIEGIFDVQHFESSYLSYIHDCIEIEISSSFESTKEKCQSYSIMDK